MLTASRIILNAAGLKPVIHLFRVIQAETNTFTVALNVDMRGIVVSGVYPETHLPNPKHH